MSSFFRTMRDIFFVYFSFFILFHHRGCIADSDTIVFPDAVSSHYRNDRSYKSIDSYKSAQPVNSHQAQRRPKEIPLELAQKLNSITDIQQLFEEFIQDTPEEIVVASFGGGNYGSSRVSGSDDGGAGGGITNRFGVDGTPEEERPSFSVERKSTLTPKPAACQTELRTVSLRDSNDPTMVYFPSCTRVDRCGGCCSHDLLSCQPISVEYLNFSVVVAQYVGGNKLEYKGKKIITVEQHTKCKCDCIVKEKDCNRLQEYNQCRCTCINKDEEAKCINDGRKLWNPSTCSCQCREVKECSTGYYFDTVTCSCVQNRRKTYYGDLDTSRYKIGSK